MGKKVLYFILGLLCPVPMVFLILLLRAQIDLPYISIVSSVLLFLLIPIFLIITQWRQRRALSVGLIASTVLMLPVLFFRLTIAYSFESKKGECSGAIIKVERYKAEHGGYPAKGSLVGGRDDSGYSYIGSCDYSYDPLEGSYSVSYRMGPGMYYYYKSSVKKWLSVSN